MNFSAAVPSWFRYEPDFDGNRKKKKDDRIACEIKRLSMAEVVARYAPDVRGDCSRWLISELEKRFMKKENFPVGTALKDQFDVNEAEQEYIDALMIMDPVQLKEYQLFCKNTRNWENCQVDGMDVADPWVLYFYLFAYTDDEGANLAQNVTAKIFETRELKANEVGNFEKSCVGPPGRTTARKTTQAKK